MANQSSRRPRSDRLRGGQNPDIVQGGTLTNPIHPIFRRQNFSPDVDYDAIEPALRLASRFLDIEELLPFWYTVLLEQNVQEYPNTRRGGKSKRYFFPRPAPLFTRDRRRLALDALTALQDCVTFGVDETMGPDEHATTDPLRGPEKRVPEKSSLAGQRSRVLLNTESLRTIRVGTRSCQMWRQCELAVTILHELVHVALFASRPGVSSQHQYFIHGCGTSEEGMEFENALFGGTLTSINAAAFTDLDVAFENNAVKLMLAEWPGPNIVRGYLSSGEHTLHVRDGWVMPEHQRLWELPDGFIPSLFRDEWWEGEFERNGLRALQPRGGKGYKFEVDKNGGRAGHVEPDDAVTEMRAITID